MNHVFSEQGDSGMTGVLGGCERDLPIGDELLHVASEAISAGSHLLCDGEIASQLLLTGLTFKGLLKSMCKLW